MDFQHGMVGGGFPMGAAAALYILFGLTVLTVVIWLQKRQGDNHHAAE